MDVRTFSSLEVSKLSELTLRQLQWWDERHLVKPRREGHRRVYFPVDVIEVLVIADLRQKGMTLPQIRKILPRLRSTMADRLPELMSGLKNLYLLIGKRRLRVMERPDEIIACIASADCAFCLISLTDHARRVRSVDILNKRRYDTPRTAQAV